MPRSLRVLSIGLVAAATFSTSWASAQTAPATTPAQPAGGAQPAGAATQPGGTDGSDGVRTSQSRVIDTTQEELEREQGQTEQEREAARRRAEEEERRRRDHKYQVGVRIAFGLPYRFRMEYGGDDSAQCQADPEGETDEAFCTELGEPALDIGLEFGITDTLELFLLMRIGLTSDEFTDANVLNLGLGLRSYTNPTDLVKFYLGFALMMDLGSTDNAMAGDYGSFDFGVRGQFGFQFDVIRYLGIFIQIDPQLFFLRYLDTAIGGSIGLQGRFP
ncbi:MAG: hypothetical protein IT379_13715 [Deltaproteobacteria bacterium]|nr:hypothetical protein [Deltaproteobacteria bacterium]